MQTRAVDIAIIGAGTAGLTAYHAARRTTEDVLLIDEGPGGTTCARVGCMPSKLLIAAADVAHTAQRGEIFGIDTGPVLIDGPRVLQRVRRERDRFVDSVMASLQEIPVEAKLDGRARFQSPHVLLVGEDARVIAQRIIIATGSRPHIPDQLAAAGSRLLLSDDVFALQDLPRSLAVFGPGPVGLELGQALHRLGVEVKMFGRDGALGGIVCKRIRDYAQGVFDGSFYLDTDADVTAVAAAKNAVKVSYQHRADGNITEEFDYLLAATGRPPRLQDLDLGNTGLALNEQGVPNTDPATLQCGNSHIFLVGDANGDAPVLHEAAEEGRIAGTNAARYPDMRACERKGAFAIVFTQPQIARVGDIAQFESAWGCERYVAGEVSFEDQGRSRIIAENRGMLRVYAERDSQIVRGAEMLGPAAEHIGHLLAWSVQQQMTVSNMLSMPYYHPVIEEAVRTALQDLSEQLGGAPMAKHRCNKFGPGG